MNWVESWEVGGAGKPGGADIGKDVLSAEGRSEVNWREAGCGVCCKGMAEGLTNEGADCEGLTEEVAG